VCVFLCSGRIILEACSIEYTDIFIPTHSSRLLFSYSPHLPSAPVTTGVNPVGDAGDTSPNILVGGRQWEYPPVLRTFGYSRPILVVFAKWGGEHPSPHCTPFKASPTNIDFFYSTTGTIYITSSPSLLTRKRQLTLNSRNYAAVSSVPRPPDFRQ